MTKKTKYCANKIKNIRVLMGSYVLPFVLVFLCSFKSTASTTEITADKFRQYLNAGDEELVDFVKGFYAQMSIHSPQRQSRPNKQLSSFNHVVNASDSQMDAFARLIVGDETCAAVCLDVAEETLLISTNRIDHTMDLLFCPLWARVLRLWEHLVMIARLSKEAGIPANNHEWVYATRFIFVQEAIPSMIKGIGGKKSCFSNLDDNLLRKFGVLLAKDFHSFINDQKNSSEIDIVDSWVDSLFNRLEVDSSTKEPRCQGSHFLLPTSLKKLVEKKVLLLSSTYENIYNVYRFFRDIYKWEKFAACVCDNNSDCFLSLLASRKLQIKLVDHGKDQVHAEMRLLNYLIINNKHASYIGVSKLCCSHCYLMMLIFGSNVTFGNLPPQQLIRGTHALACKWEPETFEWVFESLSHHGACCAHHDLLQRYEALKNKEVSYYTKKNKVVIPPMKKSHLALLLIEKIPEMISKKKYKKLFKQLGISLPAGSVPLYADLSVCSDNQDNSHKRKALYLFDREELVDETSSEFPDLFAQHVEKKLRAYLITY